MRTKGAAASTELVSLPRLFWEKFLTPLHQLDMTQLVCRQDSAAVLAHEVLTGTTERSQACVRPPPVVPLHTQGLNVSNPPKHRSTQRVSRSRSLTRPVTILNPRPLPPFSTLTTPVTRPLESAATDRTGGADPAECTCACARARAATCATRSTRTSGTHSHE